MTASHKVITDLSTLSTDEKRRLIAELLQKRQDAPSLIPLSYAQERIWFLEQLQPAQSIFNITSAVRLTGRINIPAVQWAFSEIVRRHEILRATFNTVDGRPVQTIGPPRAMPLPMVDLCGLPECERESQMLRMAGEQARQPFDLSGGPLLRVNLLRMGPDDHVITLVIHHIVFDGWSQAVLIRDFVSLYEAFCDGMPSPLRELAIQYTDFAVWQRRWLEEGVEQTQLAYWKSQLEDVPALELPLDYPRPAIRTFRGARHPLTLSKEAVDGLKALSHQQGATMFMTLLAAFNALLHRYTGQRRIPIGSLIANRKRAETQELIGFFANTLVLCADSSGEPTFRELLARVYEVCLDAYTHQDLPFERLVAELQTERDLSLTPLFQVLFVLQSAQREPLRVQALSLTPVDVETRSSQFDLALNLTDAGDELCGEFHYNCDLFHPSTVRRMADHLQILLEAVVANPDQPISRLPLLTVAEQRQLLGEWNDTNADYAIDSCIHESFQAQATRTPDAVAVTLSEAQLSYRQLNAKANQLARHLAALGVGPEVVVGVYLERSVELIVALLAILKAGGAYLPLDPAYPAQRLVLMIDDAQIELLLSVDYLAKNLPVERARVICLNAIWDEIAGQGEADLPARATADNLAYVIYTSGSTGKPKGVLLQHRGVCNLAGAQIKAFALTPSSRELQFSSLSFDASVSEIFTALLSGALLCLVDKLTLMSGPGLMALLRDSSITTVTLPPSVLAALPSEELQSLETLVVAGEACPSALMEGWSQGRRFLNAYGPTEGTVCATIAENTHGDIRLPIGRAITNVQVYLLDPYGNMVPVGVGGELHIGGAGLARGYLNAPEATAERFIPNPFGKEPGARLYKTGDLARRRPDGNIEFLGRADNQVKIRGFRIELDEVATALAQHPRVQDVIMVARGSNADARRLAAYVVTGREPVAAGELRNYLRDKLPDYMIPSWFINLESFPLSSNGKVNRHALPDPQGSRAELGTAYVSPSTETERAIAAVWREVLQVEKVGAHDNFFDLGGHSLLMMRVLSRLKAVVDREIAAIEMFKHPTVNSLATYLTRQEAEQPSFKRETDRGQSRRQSMGRQLEMRRKGQGRAR